MDNLGAIAGPLLALALVGLVGTRTAIALSIIPGLFAALAIVYAIRHAPRAEQRDRRPLRLRVRPVRVRATTHISVTPGIGCAGTVAWTTTPEGRRRVRNCSRYVDVPAVQAAAY
jgi:MFS family permease